MTSISTILLSILSFALLSCQVAQAANQNSFDNFVMSYGDFERCTFGLCRHETPAAPAKKPPHSIRAFKKARGGHSKPKNSVPPPMIAQARHSPKDINVNVNVNPCSSSASGGVTASSLECGSVDHPYGWGMF